MRWLVAHLLVEVRGVELEGRAREREESESRHSKAERASEALSDVSMRRRADARLG